MKTFGLMLAASVFSLLLFIGACQTQEKPAEKETDAASDQVNQEDVVDSRMKKPVGKEDKEAYEQEIKNQLDEMTERIREWRAEAKQVGEDAVDAINEAIDEAQFEQELDDAKQKWDELKAASADAWKEAKSEMESALVELEKSYRNAKQTLSRDTGNNENKTQSESEAQNSESAY